MKKYRKIYIEITNQCNLSCHFCSPSKKGKQWMSIEKFQHVIKQVAPYTTSIYLHVKGEPLLHPQLDQILSITDKTHLRVNITTNGTLLKRKINIINNHSSVKKLNISLHADYKKNFKYEEIWDTVKELRKDITVIYRLWALKNKCLDEKSTNIVEKMQAYYQLSPIIVEKIKAENNIKISSTIYVDKNNEFEWPEITSHKSCGYCHALKTHIAILVDGTVVPCCLDSNGIINLGNIYQESIKEIQKKERYQNLKKSFQDRKPSEKLCQSCTFKLKNNQ